MRIKIKHFTILFIMLIILLSVISGCRRVLRNVANNSYSDDVEKTNLEDVDNTNIDAPMVYSEAHFEVNETNNIVYAQGLSHNKFNSDDYEVMDLKLDLYQPADAPDERPALIYIHGGSFVTGDKDSFIVDRFAEYYVSRGFVFLSINYRLLHDYGTNPQAWVTALEENNRVAQANYFSALYPCVRDAKAAVRWLYANADELNVNTNYITVSGGSAGAFISVAVALTEDNEFRNEISIEDDPTLESSHLEYSSKVRTVVDYWGGKGIVDVYDTLENTHSYDSNDPPIIVVHGDVDATVPFSNAEDLVAAYETMDVEAVFYPLNKAGHSCWWIEIDGEPIEAAVFEEIVRIQELVVK